MTRRVAMITTSYPRFPGDGVGTFLEPIAKGIANLNHRIDVIAPWHPLVKRPQREDNVHFHFFRYAPSKNLHVFGYASALKADVKLRGSAYLVAPLAVGMGRSTLRRVVQSSRSDLIHAHWVVPSGFIASAKGSIMTIPLVVSLHGSDVYLAETNFLARMAARSVFRRASWITACSDDLAGRAIALGADSKRITVIPYGVDTDRFRPNTETREELRRKHNLGSNDPVLVTAGRLVRKKGFEYLVDSLPALICHHPRLRLVVAGGGDLQNALEQRASTVGVRDNIIFLGSVQQDDIARWLTTADVAVIPSVKDDSGNVDGLPNVLLEALSSGTPVVATAAGGMGLVAKDGQTARVVPERNSEALTTAITDVLSNPETAAELGKSGRELMCLQHSWTHTANLFNEVYDRTLRRS